MRNYQRGLPANALHRQLQAGQILLIVVLVMTIVLTVGLSIASRTITDLRTSTQQESSQRAFSAAEAGIEKSLQDTSGSSGTFTNNSSYKTTITSVSGTDFLLNNGIPVLKDDAADLWLSSYPGYTTPWSGKVTIYWGSSTDSCTTSELTNSMAALDIVLVFGAKTAPKLAHYPIDPCNPNIVQGQNRAGINGFEAILPGGGSVSGKQFAFKRTIDIPSGLLLRIIPLYAPTTIGVRGCDGSGGSCQVLPSQGKIITSVGTSSHTQRKIIGFQENPKIPMQIFPYILFSSK